MLHPRAMASVLLALLLATLLTACDTQRSDTSAPSVTFNLATSTIAQNDTVGVTARDPESGIAKVLVTFDGDVVANEQPDGVSFDPVVLDVTIDKEIEPGVEYRLEVTATNGAGLVTTRTVSLTGGGVPVDPGGDGPGDPIDPTDPTDPTDRDDTEAPVVAVYWEKPVVNSELEGSTVELEVLVRLEEEDAVADVTFELLTSDGLYPQFLGSVTGDGTNVYQSQFDTLRFMGGDYILQAKVRSTGGGLGIAVRPVTIAPQAATLTFRSPAPDARLMDVAQYDLAIMAPRAVRDVIVTLERSGASTLVDMHTGALGDSVSGSFDTLELEPGAWELVATLTDELGVENRTAVTVMVADQFPDIAFLYPSPSPNQRLAGRVDYQLEFTAPRGAAEVELELDGNRVLWETGTAALETGRLEGSFFTLDLESGSYDLVATIRDAQGNVGEATLPIEVLPPFIITSPVDGDGIGSGEDRQQVAITVGVNGTVENGLTIVRASVLINGEYLGDMLHEVSGENQLLVYTWDTGAPSAGHDPTMPGDRLVTVEIDYAYDDGPSGTRFTPGVIVDFQP